MKNLKYRGIVKIIDSFIEKNTLYYVVEYIDGITIQKIAMDIDRFNKSTIINIVFDLAKIIDYLHSNKPYPIIHCDIKPDNIIIDNFLNIYLIDFDSAFYYNEYLRSNVSFGTMEYSSPEQVLFPSKINLASDLYSFGKVVLYIMDTYFISDLYILAKKCIELIPENRPKSIRYLLDEIRLLL